MVDRISLRFLHGIKKWEEFLIQVNESTVFYRIVVSKRIVPVRWALIDNVTGELLSEIQYFQKFLIPGCKILINGEVKCILQGKFGYGLGCVLKHCDLRADMDSFYPFVVRKNEHTVAGLSLIHPGNMVAYDGFVEDTDDLLLYVSILSGYILFSKMSK